jgi:2-keto-3-deoxy-L-rhamnonate aldolase RhmA
VKTFGAGNNNSNPHPSLLPPFFMENKMQKNRAKTKLKAGELAFGSEIMFPSADVVELLGYAGLDFAYMDLEHSSTSHESLSHMIRAAEISGTTPLIRIPQTPSDQYPGCILRLLDIGAMGIIVPHVDSKVQAEAVVDAIKYPPLGHRGRYGAGRQTGYGFAKGSGDYLQRANDETLVVLMIESVAGVENLSDILSVPEVDVIQIGSNDLAQSLGAREGIASPVVIDTINHIISETRKKNIAVGVGAFASFPQDTSKHFLNSGARFVNVLTANLITSGIRQWQGWLKELQKS